MDFNEYIDKKINDWHQAQKHGCMCLVSKIPLCFYCSNKFGVTIEEHIERHVEIWRDIYINPRDAHDNFDKAMKDLF